jgi:oxygen-independent coproporphyrinogen-3 oxidase
MSATSVSLRQRSGPYVTAEARLGAIDGMVGSLYIHVPFCFHKCHYCDFYSFVDTQDRQGAFVEALILELRRLAEFANFDRVTGVVRPDQPRIAVARTACPSEHGTSRGTHVGGSRPSLQTIFVGGGTPSLLRVELWERLLAALHGSFALDAGGEFTVECNPETVTPELIRVLRVGGVNRVSVGAQSFESRHLKTLERWHDPANVQRALRLAAEGGIERRNVDLIFAVPGQTMGEWRADLERALALDPGVEHLSCYALTYEPNTAMTQRMKMGQFIPAPEELETEMYRLTVAMLRDRGFERYEVSNFARNGAECRHNMAYWRHSQWLAAGPSASAHVAGARWKNVPRLTEWMEGVNASGGLSPVVDLEEPDARRALSEQMMLGLRIAEGLDAGAVMAEAARLGVDERLRRVVRKYEAGGALKEVDGRWVLTDAGFLIADSIAAEMMAAVRSVA